jgi:VWFA-related protein
MRLSRKVMLVAALLFAPLVTAGQQPVPSPPSIPAPPSAPSVPSDPSTRQHPRPRFRGGANLVRLDAYVTADGAAVTDLTAEDFEVLEDNVPQRVESFELIRPRAPAAEAARVEPETVAEARAMATDRDARLFVLFMDIWHVHIDGSHRAQGPIVNLLDKVIGRDDMVGIMTPEMSARNLTLARRTRTLEGILKDNWFWGQRDRLITADPREREIEMCYSDAPGSQTEGIAEEMIHRRRERKTLDAIEELIVHLEGLREERKFVVMLSEGWLLPRRNDRLAVMLNGNIPRAPEIGVGPAGKLVSEDPRNPHNFESCERERQRLAADDLQMDFQSLLQRANRANVSFYAIDPRGLVAFDQDLSSRRALSPVADHARLGQRQTALRTLAETTDGIAVLNTSDTGAALERMVSDTGAYYLLGYYSTNTRLDGKFRKLTVRVIKRPRAAVRARPGYLAPTEADAASSRVDALMSGAAPGHTTMPPGFARALEGLAPIRGNVPIRVQTAAAPSRIWLTSELDASVLKLPEWQQGGRAQVFFDHDRGGAPPVQVEVALAPGQRTFNVSPPDGVALAPGRYVIRLQLTPKDGTLPMQTTVDVTVPPATALVSQSGLASRRGPSTGLQYIATADARFRRTERLRLEVPRLATAGSVSARLLGRDGQPLGVAVTVSERVEDSGQLRMIVAEVVLAPLAQGDYVLEVTVEDGGRKESASYAFRLIP